MNLENQLNKCINCKRCTQNCEFLNKYNLTLKDYEKLQNLSYHCFLCGECSIRCPVGIDGSQMILELREREVYNNNNKLKAKGYSSLLLEKGNYLFKNYRMGNKKSVLFPGCNFPAFYPKTTEFLINLLKEYDIGMVFDCCGKPISYLGLKDKSSEIVRGINERLNNLNVEEVIILCPNCYHYLKGKLSAKVVNIYDKLLELNIQPNSNVKNADVFIPCPEKKNADMLESIQRYLGNVEFNRISEIQCCGLGGCAGAYEGEIANKFTKKLIDCGYEEVYSYCASCSGNFANNGISKSHHFLSAILGIDEMPDLKNSLLNRVKTKFL